MAVSEVTQTLSTFRASIQRKKRFAGSSLTYMIAVGLIVFGYCPCKCVVSCACCAGKDDKRKECLKCIFRVNYIILYYIAHSDRKDSEILIILHCLQNK